MHRVGVSAPDIAGADESNLPAPESFRSQWPNSAHRLGELVGVSGTFGGGSSRTFREQKEEGVITINLGRFARCRMARHYRRIAFANLPFPPLWFEGGYLNFKKTREGLIGHPANMLRAPSVCQCGTLPQSN